MIDDLELRQRLARYAAGRADLATFEDWLTTETWDAAEDASPTERLAFDALRLISEHQNGDWTESELRGKLGAVGRTYWFEQAPKATAYTSASPVVTRSAGRVVPADTSLEVGFGSQAQGPPRRLRLD
jgi:hypothetical protein